MTHQGGFTQQFAATDQVSNGDVEVCVTAAPVGDFRKGMSGQDVLQEETKVYSSTSTVLPSAVLSLPTVLYYYTIVFALLKVSHPSHPVSCVVSLFFEIVHNLI